LSFTVTILERLTIAIEVIDVTTGRGGRESSQDVSPSGVERKQNKEQGDRETARTGPPEQM
jgi:hypothetical protein